MNIKITKEQEKIRDKLKNDKSFHNKIVQLVNDCFESAGRQISQRYTKWNLAEEQHLAYVNKSETDDDGNVIHPFDSSIVVPYSYAIMQTRLTYFYLAFASKTPIIPIVGRGPNDVLAAKMIELIHQYQMSQSLALKTVYCWLQDSERYGLGVIKNMWKTVKEKRWVVDRNPIEVNGINVGDELTKRFTEVLQYEGNFAVNVSPYDYFPDPRVNAADIEHMEFCGHKFRKSYNYLINEERQGNYFNIEEMSKKSKKKRGENKSTYLSRNNNLTDLLDGLDHYGDSSFSKIMGVSNLNSSSTIYFGRSDNGFFPIKELWIRLIPSEYDLADRDDPEEWCITVGNNDTVIGCDSSVYSGFPFNAIECNHDYQSTYNLGTIELMKPMSDFLSWLYNSHRDSVCSIVNNGFIVDPSMIELSDFLSGSPVKIVRMKESSWGLGMVDKAVKQIQLQDVTQNHINDAQYVMGLIQRIAATPDNVMGMVEEVKRTATETSSTVNLATSRLKLTLKLYAVLGFIPWQRQMVFNTQMLMRQGTYIRLTDDMIKELQSETAVEIIKNRIFIRPEDIYGDFDYDFPNMDLPIDKVNSANLWRQMIMDTMQNPLLADMFNVVPMFKEYLFNLGVMNVGDYLKNPSITPMPNPEIANGVSNGSLVPFKMNQGQLKDLSQVFNGLSGGGLNGTTH